MGGTQVPPTFTQHFNWHFVEEHLYILDLTDLILERIFHETVYGTHIIIIPYYF